MKYFTDMKIHILPNKLEELGVIDGDTIMLGNLEFEYKK